MDGNKSDIAAIRQQIISEYQAAQRIFTDFTVTAQHEFINARQQRILASLLTLTKDLPNEEAIQLIRDIESDMDDDHLR